MIETCTVTHISSSLIVRVIIDGEAVNTGFETGPWKLSEG